MKSLIVKFLPALAMLAAAPLMADEHHVSQNALSSIGLGEMKTVSESRGMSVRGHGTLAFVGGGSMAFGGITYHGEMSTVTFGGIDANSYKALDKGGKQAKASANPTTSTVLIPEVEVKEGYNFFKASGAVKAGAYSSPWSKAPSATAGSFSKNSHWGWGGY